MGIENKEPLNILLRIGYIILSLTFFFFFIVNNEHAGVHTAGQILADFIPLAFLLVIPLFFKTLKNKLIVFGILSLPAFFISSSLRYSEEMFGALEPIFLAVVVLIIICTVHLLFKYSERRNTMVKGIILITILILSLFLVWIARTEFSYTVDYNKNSKNLLELGCKTDNLEEFRESCNSFVVIPVKKFSGGMDWGKIKDGCFKELENLKINKSIERYPCNWETGYGGTEIQFFPPRNIKLGNFIK